MYWNDYKCVMLSTPLSFFSSDCKGTVSIGLLSLPSVDVGVEAVRLFEPLEDVKSTNKCWLMRIN